MDFLESTSELLPPVSFPQLFAPEGEEHRREEDDSNRCSSASSEVSLQGYMDSDDSFDMLGEVDPMCSIPIFPEPSQREESVPTIENVVAQEAPIHTEPQFEYTPFGLRALQDSVEVDSISSPSDEYVQPQEDQALHEIMELRSKVTELENIIFDLQSELAIERKFNNLQSFWPTSSSKPDTSMSLDEVPVSLPRVETIREQLDEHDTNAIQHIETTVHEESSTLSTITALLITLSALIVCAPLELAGLTVNVFQRMYRAITAEDEEEETVDDFDDEEEEEEEEQNEVETNKVIFSVGGDDSEDESDTESTSTAEEIEDVPESDEVNQKVLQQYRDSLIGDSALPEEYAVSDDADMAFYVPTPSSSSEVPADYMPRYYTESAIRPPALMDLDLSHMSPEVIRWRELLKFKISIKNWNKCNYTKDMMGRWKSVETVCHFHNGVQFFPIDTEFRESVITLEPGTLPNQIITNHGSFLVDDNWVGDRKCSINLLFNTLKVEYSSGHVWWLEFRKDSTLLKTEIFPHGTFTTTEFYRD